MVMMTVFVISRVVLDTDGIALIVNKGLSALAPHGYSYSLFLIELVKP